ncbi:MAG: hypothetical protein JST43_06655 [Bacteroidetes bacterium]|nr:hypothetical protein [Bacteroidota bacterium]MBS1539629.1 hypothetical protein [Bacteroidota bacterium]
MLKPTSLRLSSALFIFLLIVSCSKPEVKPTPPPLDKPQLPVNLIGYANKISFYPGELINLYLSADNQTNNCLLKIYDIHHDSVFHINTPIKHQAIANAEPWKDGFGFTLTTSFTVPSSLASGFYLIDNKIPFIIKPQHTPDVVVVFPSNTESAYCQAGGKSLYRPIGSKAQVLSFLRPILFPHENKKLNFLEKGLQLLHAKKDVSIGYICDMDLDDYASIQGAKLLIIPGHSEYWTRAARKNFDRFVENGNNALILSGNTMWWQVRYSDDKKQLICYKGLSDPIADPLLKTINWVDPSLHYPVSASIGVDYVHGGHGQYGWYGYKIILPQSPLLQGTGLKQDDILHVSTDEYDGIEVSSYQNGVPIPKATGFYKYEMIGYDIAEYAGQPTVAACVALQKNKNSGVIVNMSSTDWCAENGMGGIDKEKISRITHNAIRLLTSGRQVFVN